MTSGALSGITNNIAVYPLDLVRKKRRLQVQGNGVSWYICLLNIVKQRRNTIVYIKGLIKAILC
ncbi:hypothetical protein BCV72DRAFT_218726 [Rhizopus microsporus var. microsporus]|uniref:Uncharacterized protein n=2 Tax=Rhizopus microsporus TaxID=58291 RepID=A0A2G4SZX9_RHIZD|nr:uncharacterized protein RHIMIDRAFT_278788 [Rhizopus microsporus ATCC 52813]ORE11998.1 hypothetical protein BCV72DRAFT_218726 [Rhizopus microsporus var. microsporus]PHZ14304.1 hypothetical protein RHIMIDRAFT_278788 [Rhizopus microsporus ATCC 52813]